MARSNKHFNIRHAVRPILIVLGAIMLLNVGFYFFFVRPDLADLRAVEKDSTPKFEALELKRGQVERLEGYLNGLNQADTDLHFFREEVLSTRGRRMVEVQTELAKLCRQFDIDLDMVAYEDQSLAAEDLELFRMVVPLEGGYQSLRTFLQAVESSDKFLLVQSVVLGQSGAEGQKFLQLDITLDTYFDAPERSPEPADRRRGPGRA